MRRVDSSHIKVASVTDFATGQTALVGTGADLEPAVTATFGTADATTLRAAINASVTEIPVASAAGFSAGQNLSIDSGTNQETAVVVSTTAGGRGGNAPQPILEEDTPCEGPARGFPANQTSFMLAVMRNLIVFVGAVSLVASSYSAQDPASSTAPVPRYEVRRVASPITIDGKLDEAAWTGAAAVTLQFLWESQTGARQMTYARLLWDGQALYVGYDADDADINAQFLNRDDPTYQDDAVEIFINPDPKQETVYYGFEMNARGVLYDYLNYNSRTLFKRWDATGMKIATSIRGTMNVRTDTDKGWSLEASIPWANFEELSRRPPAVGAVWKVNFNRWDGVQPNRRMSIWSDPQNTTSWPHVPSRFGEIVFVE